MKTLPCCRGIVVLLLAWLPAPIAAQTPPEALTLRPMRPLERWAAGPLPWLAPSLLLPSEWSADQLRSCGGEDFLGITDLLTRLHGTDEEADRLHWELPDHGGLLLLRGQQDLVDTCNQELDRLAAIVHRPIEVTVWRLPGGGAPLPAVLDAAALQQALAAQPPQWQQQQIHRGGVAAHFVDARYQLYVREIETMVAKDARIGVPRVAQAHGGLRVDCALWPLAGGAEIVVEAALRLGEDLQWFPFSPGKDLPELELMACSTALARGAARVPDGGAMVFDLQSRAGAGPSCRLVVGVRYAAPAPPPIADRLMVVPVGALLLAGLDDDWGPTPPYLLSDPGAEAPSPGGGIASRLGEDALLQYLTHGLGDQLDARIEGDHLIATVTPAERQRLLAALQQLGDARLANLQVLFETREIPAAGEAAGARPTPLWRLSLPALSTRSCSAFLGTEQTLVAALEGEVAESAATYVPKVAVCQTGVWPVLSLGEPRPALPIRGQCMVIAHEPLRKHEVGGLHDGTITLADPRYSLFVLPDSMTPGQEMDLGDGPVAAVGGQHLRTRQYVRLLRR